MRQPLYFEGKGVINHLKDVFEKYNPSNILIVRGHDSYNASGVKYCIESILNKHGIRTVEFSGFSVNPKEKDVREGLKLLENKKIDLIIAAGGGSVVDMAKLIRFFHAYDEHESGQQFVRRNATIPLVAIPTTAGTGSEATHFAVLYKDKKKYSVAHEAILPDIAIVDPSFTYNNSPYLTAVSGFDALSQAIEAYWNVNATKESDSYADQAIQLLAGNLLRIMKQPENREIRSDLSKGAFLSGKAINITKTTAPHAFSYPFTMYYNYPHGHAVAMTFPFFIWFNYTELQEQLSPKVKASEHVKKMKKLYNWLGIGSIETATVEMAGYIEKLGLSLILPDNFDTTIIRQGINTERAGNNPRILSETGIEQALLCLQNNSYYANK